MAKAEGHSRMNDNDGTYSKFKHEYNFFEFRSTIENPQRAFDVSIKKY